MLFIQKAYCTVLYSTLHVTVPTNQWINVKLTNLLCSCFFFHTCPCDRGLLVCLCSDPFTTRRSLTRQPPRWLGGRQVRIVTLLVMYRGWSLRRATWQRLLHRCGRTVSIHRARTDTVFIRVLWEIGRGGGRTRSWATTRPSIALIQEHSPHNSLEPCVMFRLSHWWEIYNVWQMALSFGQIDARFLGAECLLDKLTGKKVIFAPAPIVQPLPLYSFSSRRVIRHDAPSNSSAFSCSCNEKDNSGLDITLLLHKTLLCVHWRLKLCVVHVKL